MTINHLMVDVAQCFAGGHVYVALSRVPSFSALVVKNYKEDKIFMDPRAKMYQDKTMLHGLRVIARD